MTKTQKESLKYQIEYLRSKENLEVCEAKQLDFPIEEVVTIYNERITLIEKRMNAHNLARYILKSGDGKQISINIVDGTPDPSNWIVTNNSPIAQRLKECKINDSILIGQTPYKIVNIF